MTTRLTLTCHGPGDVIVFGAVSTPDGLRVQPATSVDLLVDALADLTVVEAPSLASQNLAGDPPAPAPSPAPYTPPGEGT